MLEQNIITIEPGKPSGKSCIRGMRITVDDVLYYLAAGITYEELLEDFPYFKNQIFWLVLVMLLNGNNKL